MLKRILKHSFSLLHVDKVKLGVQWNYNNVISPYHRIYYIDEGIGEISDTYSSFTLEAGFLYIIPSYTLCNLTCQEYLSQFFVQFFEESADGISMFENNRQIYKIKARRTDIVNFKRLLEINPKRGINRSFNPKVYEKNLYYAQYEQLNKQQSFSHFVETQGILLQLISRWFTIKNAAKRNQTTIAPAKVLDSLGFIALNIAGDLSVKNLADRSNLNVNYFSRLFRKHVGMGPVAYVNKKRIERATYLIKAGLLSHNEIAVELGYQSSAYFSKIFKKTMGISPMAYYRANRK